MSQRILVAILSFALPLAAAAQAQPADVQQELAESLRARGWQAILERVPDKKFQTHLLAVEAIMRAMAAKAGENQDIWGLAGLLHDIDIAETKNDMPQHGVVGARMLAELKMPAPVIHAVKSHDDHSGVARVSKLDKALYCADLGYWMILGTGLSYPSEEFNHADPKDVWEKAMSQPGKEASRAKLDAECRAAGLSLEEYVPVAMRAMKDAQWLRSWGTRDKLPAPR